MSQVMDESKTLLIINRMNRVNMILKVSHNATHAQQNYYNIKLCLSHLGDLLPGKGKLVVCWKLLLSVITDILLTSAHEFSASPLASRLEFSSNVFSFLFVQLLADQFHILETMTPLDFMDFRYIHFILHISNENVQIKHYICMARFCRQNPGQPPRP